MAENILYHSKGRGKKHIEETLDQSKIENHHCKLQPFISISNSKFCSDLQILPALLTEIYLRLLPLWGYYHTWFAAFLGRYLMTLASSKSYSLQPNLSFTYTASHSGLS